MGPACKNMLKRLAQKIADKRGEGYSNVINHLRTRLRFAILKGVLIALTGERGKHTKDPDAQEDRDLYSVNFNLIPQSKSYEPR